MVRTAVNVAAEYDLSVWSAPSLKPLSADDVGAAARASAGLVTLEEHSVLGGLGAAVSEITSERQPTRVLRIGVPDRFSEHCGTYNYLLQEHSLNQVMIAKRIYEFIGSL